MIDMDKSKILKYGLIIFLVFGIIYFSIRLAHANNSDEDASISKENTEIPSTIDLSEIDKVEKTKKMASIIKEYEGFTVDFNPENKTPNYVAWILQGEETEGASARSNKFWTDKDLKGCPDTRDYSRSGYDRGHMCPAGEQKWSDEAMHNSFVMANICPQKHELNTGAWKTLEDKERTWAKRDGAIVIIAGPIYDSSDTETIGYAKVRVPSAFFKVLLAPYANPMRAIGFVYPNMKCEGNMSNYAVTVDDVEKMTGLDFFSTLPDDIENDIESTMSFKDWNSNHKKKGKAYEPEHS